MRTVVKIDKKTGEITMDVQDGIGAECQEKNRHYYDRLKRELGYDDAAFKEEPKPEMMYPTPDSEQQGEQIGN